MSDVTRIAPAATPTHEVGAAPAQDVSPKFQELLERLQKLAGERRVPPEVDSPEQLRDALRTADDGFVAAMDLRRQLEAAFKKHMP